MSRKARRSLRLTCRQSKQLVDLLLTSAHLCLYLAEADSHHLEEAEHWRQWPLPEDRQAAAHRLAAERAALQETMEHFASFAARLPRLAALVLKSWHTEADLVTALALVGATTGGRVSCLHLGGQRLCAPTLQAVREACPGLEELQLENCGPPGRERASSLTLEGEVFAPLWGSQLKRLEVGWEVNCSSDMLRSLGGLSLLEDLSLSVHNFRTHNLRLLGGLRNLRTCYIGYLHPNATLLETTFLFYSTGLVSLKLDVQHWGVPGSSAEPPPEVARAVALLGCLVHLEVLDLGPEFFAGGAETAALLRCVRLQELTLGGMQADAPSPGHLPDLHTLCIGQDEGLIMTPSRLLQTLLPLLPLPSLTSLNGEHDVKIDIALHDADANGAALLAADLRQALLHLAAAPQLLLGGPGQPELVFCAYEDDDGGWELPLLGLPQLADALLPWVGGGRLTHLHLTDVALPSRGWEALQARLPGLSHLHLGDCKVGRAALVAIARGWTALRRLSISNCETPRKTGWVRMAECRAHPLLLDVYVAAEVMARCHAVQEACYGASFIEWVGMAAPVVVDEAFVLDVDDDEMDSEDSLSDSSSDTLSDEGDDEIEEDGDLSE